MTILRVTREDYRERLGPDAPSPEEVFERGARSYLEHPRVTKLTAQGTPEERLDELVLMLAQNRASYGVIRMWNATEGRDYAATREEYTALADEFERLQAVASQAEAEIRALSGEVAKLEAKLRDAGVDPDEVLPPWPQTVARPAAVIRASSREDNALRGLWERLLSRIGR